MSCPTLDPHRGKAIQNPKSKIQNPAETYAAAGAATLALFGALAGVLVGWLLGAAPRSMPGQGTLAGADIIATTLVAGLFGAGLGALVGALWGLNIPRESAGVADPEHGPGSMAGERVVPLDYTGNGYEGEPGLRRQEPAPVLVEQESISDRNVPDEMLMPPAQTANPPRDVVEEHEGDWEGSKPVVQPGEEATMDDTDGTGARMSQTDSPGEEGLGRGRSHDSVTGTQGAIDPETGAYGTAGTPVTTGYGVSGSTIGTGSANVREEHEAGDFAGSTPDTASYEMGGRGSDDTPTPLGRDDSTNTPVEEKYNTSMADEAPAQSDPRTQDVYEAGPAYGPGSGRVNASEHSRDSTLGSDASLDSPPTSRRINSQEIDGSGGTDIAGTADPRGLGDNTDET